MLSFLGDFSITIEFSPQINGQNSIIVTLTEGFFQLENLNASIKGNYTITVKGNEIIQNSSTFQVEACKLFVTFVENKVIITKILYVRNIFSILVEIYINVNSYCTKSSEIFLNLEPEDYLLGTKNATFSNGLFLFEDLFIEKIGTFKIRASGLNIASAYSKEIYVDYCYLEIAFIEKNVIIIQPYTTESVFSVEITAYSDENLINFALDFTDVITLYLEPQGKLSGTLTKTITWFTTFQNLIVQSENIYSILALSEISIVISTEYFEIKNNYMDFSFTSPIVFFM